jgi:tetratricopeptide (TPR) repeat protein
LNNVELANSVLKDVKAQKRDNAAKTIQLLLNNNADLGNNWGGITRLAVSIGEFSLAINASQRYLAVAPNEKKRIIQTAAILAECREISTAINLVTPLLTEQKSPDILHFLGTVHSQIGNLDLAKQYLVELLEIAPKAAISWLTLAAIHTFKAEDELYQQLMSLTAFFKNNNKAHDAPYWFALGKAALDVNEANKAFQHFSHGCQLMHNDKAYSSKQHAQFIDQIIQNQNAEHFKSLPILSQDDSPCPIFIIGLPRSGTTLLQQLLTAHSQIGQGGELKYLSFSTAEIGQDRLNKMATQENPQSLAILQKIQSDYQHLLLQQFDLDKPVVDKTLNLNHHLGVISRAFPHAPMIRITRNAEDNAWSCYRNFFSQGIAWSYDLKNIAEFFHHENHLAEHWNQVLGDHILHITYEDLVDKPRETLSRCLNHIGLAFEPELLSFYSRNALVQTASVGQVRRPINKNSINNHQSVKSQLAIFTEHKQQLSKP